VIEIRRAGDRYCVEQPGITTWHCFSAGAYYDPDNVALGRLVACDEHLVAPGAGFDEHAHAGTELLTWVLDGTLAHADSLGRRRFIQPGVVQYQATGRGIRHSERNASRLEPVHFIQLALLTDGEQSSYRVADPPLTTSVGRFDVLTRCRSTGVAGPLVHLFVGSGNFHVAGQDLAAGDSVRAGGELEVDGDGELLVVIVNA
jgi:hypothetical protein